MGKLINCLDLRNGKIKVNGEEFMALPVAFNESFSWVVCEWQHLSKLTKNRFTIVYNVDPLSVEYVVIGKLQHTTMLMAEVYIDGKVHSRSSMLPKTILKTEYHLAEIKLAEDEN